MGHKNILASSVANVANYHMPFETQTYIVNANAIIIQRWFYDDPPGGSIVRNKKWIKSIFSKAARDISTKFAGLKDIDMPHQKPKVRHIRIKTVVMRVDLKSRLFSEIFFFNFFDLKFSNREQNEFSSVESLTCLNIVNMLRGRAQWVQTLSNLTINGVTPVFGRKFRLSGQFSPERIDTSERNWNHVKELVETKTTMCYTTR
jgi:hypothetical protein